LAAVDVAEALFVRNVQERAAQVVAPGMIRTDERLLAAAARRFFEPCAAMTADVEERALVAFTIHHRDHRRLAVVVSDEIALLLQSARVREGQGELTEQDATLGLQYRRIGVALDLQARGPIDHVDRARF